MIPWKVATGIGLAMVVSTSGRQVPSSLYTDRPTSTAPSAACEVSTAVRAERPRPPNSDSLGSGPWYINEDQTIWVAATQLRAGSKGNKVPWIRPRDTELKVSGERIDAQAPPMQAEIPCCYGGRFQISGLTFPAAGCWRISATAGASTLVFTTIVREAPATYEPATRLESALYTPDALRPVRPCLVLAHDCTGQLKMCLLAPERCEADFEIRPAEAVVRYEGVSR